ncbi:hypothetical protein PENSPDRAFT_735274 [Peniophora sp. CONT]|nr:hypothetical protein PENSPDRAFT_735274 [Peniophora sp. CONT]
MAANSGTDSLLSPIADQLFGLPNLYDSPSAFEPGDHIQSTQHSEKAYESPRGERSAACASFRSMTGSFVWAAAPSAPDLDSHRVVDLPVTSDSESEAAAQAPQTSYQSDDEDSETQGSTRESASISSPDLQEVQATPATDVDLIALLNEKDCALYEARKRGDKYKKLCRAAHVRKKEIATLKQITAKLAARAFKLFFVGGPVVWSFEDIPWPLVFLPRTPDDITHDAVWKFIETRCLPEDRFKMIVRMHHDILPKPVQVDSHLLQPGLVNAKVAEDAEVGLEKLLECLETLHDNLAPEAADHSSKKCGICSIKNARRDSAH